MNASAKRICATPELMQLDQQMGVLARRAGPHLASYKSDQKRFREALKSCQGDESCLKSSYATRISELQAVVDALPPPSDEEAAELQKGMAKENEKLAGQSNARAFWEKRLAKQDALTKPVIQGPSEGASVASASSASQSVIQEAGAGSVAAPSEIVPNKPDQSASVAATQSASASAEDVQPEQTGKVPAQSGQPAADDAPSWLGVTFFATVAWMVVTWIWRGLRRAFKVCPRCKKWNAGKEIDRDQNSYTDYVTRNFTDTHHDRMGVKTGSTTKQRQVRVRVTKTVVKLKCRYCGNVWSQSSTSRSG